MTRYFSNQHRMTWLIFMILGAAVFLTLSRLHEPSFWSDEASVGIVGKTHLQSGRLSGWDGRNLLAYRDGTLLDARLRPINPPLEDVLVSASFRLLGVSNFAGRLPFAVIGLASLLLFLLILRSESKNEALIFYALAALSFSVVFLLNIRQCRYYSLSIFFSLATFYFYKRCLAPGRTWPYLVLSLMVIGNLFAHYLLGVCFTLAVVVAHLVCNRHLMSRSEHGRGYRKFLLSAVLTAAAFAPYAVAFRIWHRPDSMITEPWYLRKPLLLWWHLRDLSAAAYLPWMIVIGLAYLLWANRHNINAPSEFPLAKEWATLILSYAVFLALLSPQPTSITSIADTRYLLPLVPFCAGLCGIFLSLLHGRSKPAAAFLLAVVVCTNVLTLHPANTRFRWLLPAYIQEITYPYPTAAGEVVKFMEAEARQDETILAVPEYMNYPLMFYVGDKMRFAALLSNKTSLPHETLRKLQAPLFMDENFPEWLVAFGGSSDMQRKLDYFQRPHAADGIQMAYTYNLARVLNVFAGETQRPELPWHSFGPVTNFDGQAHAVYIFRRGPLNPVRQ